MASSDGPAEKTCPKKNLPLQIVSTQVGPGQMDSSSMPDNPNGSADESVKKEPGDPDHNEVNEITDDLQNSCKDGDMGNGTGDSAVPGLPSFPPNAAEDESNVPPAGEKKYQELPKPVADPMSVYDYVWSLDNSGQSLVTGIVDYMRGLDDRLGKIEDKLLSECAKSDSGKGDDPAPEGMTRADSQPQDVKLEAKFFEASEDDFWPEGDVKDLADQPERFSSTRDEAQVLRVMYNTLPGQPDVNKASPDPAHVEVIYVSILSDAIASFFREALGLDCGSGHSTIRLARPFRPLIRIIKPLKDQLIELEELYGHLQTEDLTDSSHVNSDGTSIRVDSDGKFDNMTDDPVSPTILPETTSSEQHEKPFRRPSALRDIKLVIEFVDRYLSKSVDVYERITSGKDDTVAFEDLWMLYEPNTTIYCPFKPRANSIYACDGLTDRTDGSGIWGDIHSPSRYAPQAYHVLSTRGGIPLKKSLMPGATEEEDEEDDLWQNFGTFLKLDVFRHGESGGHRKDGQLAVARHGLGGAPPRRKSKYTMSSLTIACFNIEYDGDKFGAQRDIFEISPYDGLKEIRSLQVYPMQYLDQQRKDRLLERGRKFVDMTKNAHMSYEGTTAGRARETINSEVIVDFKMAFERDNPQPEFAEIQPDIAEVRNYWPKRLFSGNGEAHDWYEHYPLQAEDSGDHRYCYGSACQKPTYYKSLDTQSQKRLRALAWVFDDHKALKMQTEKSHADFKSYLDEKGLSSLFPGVVPGYALRNRKWVMLDVDTLEDVQHGDDWKNLVLPKGHKEMVQAMVESYTRRSDATQATHDIASFERADMDLVRGKGKGCIILLHGEPGVGKTSTAECVAAYTKRPLYPITCGDIGHVPNIVEDNLEKHFKLAHNWACVLLLDEADVFLAKRTKTDVKRNGLVSVFLRILEYYPGILFLTTNRVGAIDDAFRSRLHLTLYYPKLLEKQSIKIWRNNITKLKEANEFRKARGQQAIIYNKDEILKWAELNWENLRWNGRQIRNAFQTAIALAEFEAQPKSSSKKKSADSASGSPKQPLLSQDTFLTIAKASTQFNDYLLDTHGKDEDAIAVRDQTRLSNFQAKPTKLKRVEDSSESDTDSDDTSHSSDSKSSADSDIESNASGESDGSISDAGGAKKRKKTGKRKGKAEKKSKDNEISEDVEKADKKAKDKRKKKKRSES